MRIALSAARLLVTLWTIVPERLCHDGRPHDSERELACALILRLALRLVCLPCVAHPRGEIAGWHLKEETSVALAEPEAVIS